jgi:hypothetical protein
MLFVPGGSRLSAYAMPAAAGAVPVNLLGAGVDGRTLDGDQVAADVGAWSNLPSSYGYQWERCDASGNGCVAIDGALDADYKLTGADAGGTVRVIVSATNATGTGTAVTSSASTIVVSRKPAVASAPGITGTAIQGSTLTASAGTWTNNPVSYAYQWERCSGTCAAIAGASGSTHTLGPADVGSTIEVTVTASNAAGSVSATSQPTATVTGLMSAPPPPPDTPLAPVNVVPPSIGGTLAKGATLTASLGGWQNGVEFYTVQWLRCSGSPQLCAPIDGATTTTYRTKPGDVGATVRILVTAYNRAGDASGYSDLVGPVASSPAKAREVTRHASYPAAPVVSLLAKTSVLAVHGASDVERHGLRVHAMCRSKCTLAVRVLLAPSHAGGREPLLAAATAHGSANVATAVLIKLSRSAAATLRRSHHGRLLIEIAARNTAGTTASAVYTARL